MAEVKYPDIIVVLVGKDGNALAIVGAVKKALERAGVPEEETGKFVDEAMAGDYDNLLRVCMAWVNVE